MAAQRKTTTGRGREGGGRIRFPPGEWEGVVEEEEGGGRTARS